MTNILKRWIEDRLGKVFQNYQEEFINESKDGFLLCQLLKSYGVITKEDLASITKGENLENCFNNFKLITAWLHRINIGVSADEISEIVNGSEMVATNLFYKTYLALNDTTGLKFTSKKIFNENLPPEQSSKFNVKKVLEEKALEKNRKLIWKNNFDIINWHRDRVEMMVNKCKLAHEEYVHIVKNRSCRKSSLSFIWDVSSFDDSKKVDTDFSEKSLDFSVEETDSENINANKNVKEVPCRAESKKIIMNLKKKHKSQEEKALFKRELYKKILWKLWEKVKDEEKEDFDNNIVDRFLTQSLYEKQMLKKMQEVKHHKESVMENKKIIADNINKEKEREFSEKIFGEDNDGKIEEFQFYIEKERSLALHKHIYERKIKLRNERCYKMCHEIIQQLCDYAWYESEYILYYGEAPKKSITNLWKQLFLDDIPLKGNSVLPEDIVQSFDDGEGDSIVQLELERQDKIDKQDFKNYIHFEPPFQLDGIDTDDSSIYEMKCGLNIIGTVVQNVLDTKYPLQPSPEMPDLPKMEIAVCINGLYEYSCLPILRKLLKHKNYEIFEMEDIINFCINAYRGEISVDIVDSYDPVEIKGKQSFMTKKGMKSKPKSTENRNQNSDLANSPTTEKVDKKLQTPKYFPWEEIVLSNKAQLGKIAEEELTEGQALTDFLQVSMFVEYLKSRINMKGWVSVNFPTTDQQTLLMEKTLSGKQIFDEVDTNGSLGKIMDMDSKACKKEKDQYFDLRHSRILKFPLKANESTKHVTALTAFINLVNESAQEEINSNNLIASFHEINNCSSVVKDFYTSQGCFYELCYTSFDFVTIKKLAKLIVGHCSIHEKSSFELFGNSIKILYKEMGMEMLEDADTISQKNKTTQKQIKKSSMPNDKNEDNPEIVDIKKPLKKSKSNIPEFVDKTTQLPEVEEDISEKEGSNEMPNVGETGWVYIDLKPPEDLQNILATLWENTEEIYVVDMSQVFFMKRILLNECMPFIKYVKDHMSTYTKKPNKQQILLQEFQRVYNIFDEDIRNDDEFKAEYHCRINEMCENLMHISDQVMLDSEGERTEIINKDWVPMYLIEITNNYIVGFQLELDRFVDTLNLLNDYYTGIVTKTPYDELLAKDLLPKIPLEDISIRKDINKYLKEVKISTVVRNPLLIKIAEVLDRCIAFVNKTSQTALLAHGKIKKIIFPYSNSTKEKKVKVSSQKNLKGYVLSGNDKVKDQYQKICEEWICGIRGETARVLIFLKLLNNDLTTNLNEVFGILKETFHDIYENIRSQYSRAVTNVNNLCTLFTRAVEAEYPIKEQLILENDDFFVDIFSYMFPENPYESKQQAELVDAFAFKLDQLDKITDILFSLAPNGFIAERSLAYLLQDMVIDDEFKTQLPRGWTKLKSDDINTLSLKLFGDVEFVPWKEFITRNLLLPYPTSEALINLRKAFLAYDIDSSETVSKEDYDKIHLWFETSVVAIERLFAIKQLLLKLYRCNENRFNYTAMLMDFCKGETFPEGFGKAVSVCIGKPTCWNFDIGIEFVEDTLYKRRLHEEEKILRSQEMIQNKNDILEIINNIISATVHRCESLVIEELPVEKVKPKRKSNSKKHSRPDINISSNIMNQSKNSNKIRNTSEGSIKLDVKVSKKPNKSNGNIEPKRNHKLRIKSESGVNFNSIIKKETSESFKEIQTERKSPEKKTNMFTPEVSIEHEAMLYPLNYFVPFDVIKNILNMVFWNISVNHIEDKSIFEIAEDLFNESRRQDFHNEVLAHEYLNNPKFMELFEHTSKFVIKNPIDIVSDLLGLNNIKL